MTFDARRHAAIEALLGPEKAAQVQTIIKSLREATVAQLVERIERDYTPLFPPDPGGPTLAARRTAIAILIYAANDIAAGDEVAQHIFLTCLNGVLAASGIGAVFMQIVPPEEAAEALDIEWDAAQKARPN